MIQKLKPYIAILSVIVITAITTWSVLTDDLQLPQAVCSSMAIIVLFIGTYKFFDKYLSGG